MTTETIPTVEGLTPEAAAALSERLAEPEALRVRRLQALTVFDQTPMPTTADRTWRYVDVGRIKLEGLKTFAPAGGDVPTALQEGLDAGGVLRHNSEIVQVTPHVDRDVRVLPLSQAAAELAPVVEKYLAGEALPPGHSKFAALSGAFHSGGVLVYVPRNVEASQPVRIATYVDADNLLVAPRTLIVAEANSRVTVIEEFVSSDARIVAVPAVEVYPLDGAQVNYTSVHTWGNETRTVFEQRTPLGRDAALESVTVSLRGRLMKGHIESLMIGDGSRSELLGLAFGVDSEQVDLYTVQDHIGRNTVSDLLMKSALKDRARSAYYGLTRVNKSATGSDANQENRNLLLSDHAKADSDPVLEILTPEVVRCSHGATVGPVDEEQLFYLQARGIALGEAEMLLLQGFFNQVLDRVGDERLRDRLAAAVEEELERDWRGAV